MNYHENDLQELHGIDAILRCHWALKFAVGRCHSSMNLLPKNGVYVPPLHAGFNLIGKIKWLTQHEIWVWPISDIS